MMSDEVDDPFGDSENDGEGDLNDAGRKKVATPKRLKQRKHGTSESKKAFSPTRSKKRNHAKIPGPEVQLEEERPKKKKVTRKKSTFKRFKTDPNESAETTAQKSLMTDTLFGSDVVSVILSFLDARQLLRFVFVSKEFKSLLTYDRVIRSAMLSGAFSLTSLEKLARPIREHKIWIPSPLRLLRITCGKRCECCDVKINRVVDDFFGVFWCKNCSIKSTQLFRRNKLWKGYLDAPRVNLGCRKGMTHQSHMYLIKTPMKDVAGENIGPLVTAHDLETMMAQEDTDHPSKTPAEKVAAWIQKCDDQQPQADAAAKSILKALEDNRQDAVNRRAAIQKEKEDARRKPSHEVIAILMDLLQDADPDIISEMNTRKWSKRYNQYLFREQYYSSYDGGYRSIVEGVLVPVFSRPRTYTKEKLQEVADKLRSLTEEQKLMDIHIQKIVEHCGHPRANDQVMRRRFDINDCSFHFDVREVNAILNEPLRNPRDLSDERVQELAVEVKKIALRKGPGEEILQKLKLRLEDLPFVGDLDNCRWDDWSWRWKFTDDYIKDILYDPISKPFDVFEEELDTLEKRLREVMKKKKLVADRMELLLAPIAERYPRWHGRLEEWDWNFRTNHCTFQHYRARRVLHRYKRIKHVEKMDDNEIGELSNYLLTAIGNYDSDEEEYGLFDTSSSDEED